MAPFVYHYVLDVVSAATDDLPDPLFLGTCSRMVVAHVLNGYLEEFLVVLGPESVATVA